MNAKGLFHATVATPTDAVLHHIVQQVHYTTYVYLHICHVVSPLQLNKVTLCEKTP